MGNLRFRMPLDNNNAPEGTNKIKYLISLAVVCLIVLTFIPDISFAISMDDPELVAQEVKRIKKFEDTVKREGDTLFLKSSSGTYIPLNDNPECEVPISCVYFRFVDYFKDLGFFLVKSHYWEGTDHIMISESDGRKFYIYELPLFSPDRRRLVTIPNDTDAGYDRNGVFVWGIEGNEIIPEFSYEPREYVQYRFARWKDNEYIELEKWLESPKSLCPEYRYMTIPVSLEMETDGWKLYEDFSPDSVECDTKYLRR